MARSLTPDAAVMAHHAGLAVDEIVFILLHGDATATEHGEIVSLRDAGSGGIGKIHLVLDESGAVVQILFAHSDDDPENPNQLPGDDSDDLACRDLEPEFLN